MGAMEPEEVWKANEEKTAFVKGFPGWVREWEGVAGKRVEKVFPLAGRPGLVLLFHDRSFAVIPRPESEIADLLAGLMAVRPELEAERSAEYRELDRLTGREKELQRQSRLQKILGAVTHNMPEIPELKEALLKLLSRLYYRGSRRRFSDVGACSPLLSPTPRASHRQSRMPGYSPLAHFVRWEPD